MAQTIIYKVCQQIEVRRTTPVWRQFLLRLNDFVSTGETRIEGSQKVHIEHVLPQKPSQDGLAESELTLKEAQGLINCIGNLTLLSGKKNEYIPLSVGFVLRSGFSPYFSLKKLLYSLK